MSKKLTDKEKESAFWNSELYKQTPDGTVINPYSLPEIEVVAKRKREEANPVGKVSDTYRKLGGSKWGTLYDVANAGLYAAAPFTGGVTLLPAMAMTGAQAIGAAIDMYDKGANLNNSLDLASAIPGFGLSGKLARKGVYNIIKNLNGKNLRNAQMISKKTPLKHLISNDAINDSYKFKYKTLPSMAKENKVYAPYAAAIIGEDAANHGLNMWQIYNDVKDTK